MPVKKEKVMGEDIRICPKCKANMGKQIIKEIIVDKCPECLGVFLDRNELEKLDVTLADRIQEFFTTLFNGV